MYLNISRSFKCYVIESVHIICILKKILKLLSFVFPVEDSKENQQQSIPNSFPIHSTQENIRFIFHNRPADGLIREWTLLKSLKHFSTAL